MQYTDILHEKGNDCQMKNCLSHPPPPKKKKKKEEKKREEIIYTSVYASVYAPNFEKVGSILLSACPYVRPSVRLSVRSKKN